MLIFENVEADIFMYPLGMDIGAVWCGVLCDLASILRPSMASCFGYEYGGIKSPLTVS